MMQLRCKIHRSLQQQQGNCSPHWPNFLPSLQTRSILKKNKTTLQERMVSVQTRPPQVEQYPTCNQSVVLVRNLIRIAISTIAYERRLFPSDFFRDRVLAGTNIKALNPEDENSKLLVSWLEDGVFEALEKKYLHKIILNLFEELECITLLERYEFKIEYSESDGNVSISLSKNGFQPFTRTEIKETSINLVTQIIDLAEKLPPVPAKCYCSFNLEYLEDAPGDYQPTGFAHMDAREQAAEKGLQYSYPVGQVGTEHHRMGLCLKLGVDLFEDMHRSQTQPNTQEENVTHLLPVTPRNHQEENLKRTIDKLTCEVLRLICDGRRGITSTDVKSLGASDRVSRELLAHLEKKKVVGAYNKSLRMREILKNKDSIEYLKSFGLMFQDESENSSPKRGRGRPRKESSEEEETERRKRKRPQSTPQRTPTVKRLKLGKRK